MCSSVLVAQLIDQNCKHCVVVQKIIDLAVFFCFKGEDIPNLSQIVFNNSQLLLDF